MQKREGRQKQRREHVHKNGSHERLLHGEAMASPCDLKGLMSPSPRHRRERKGRQSKRASTVGMGVLLPLGMGWDGPWFLVGWLVLWVDVSLQTSQAHNQ